jgi:hypothetical protein
VVDGVDDRGRLVDIAEVVRGADRPDHQELRVSAEAGDPLVVRDRTCGEGGDEGAVAGAVRNARTVVDDVPGLGGLGGEVGLCDVGACVDDADLDRACSAQHVRRHLVLARRDVLPLVGKSWAQNRGQGRFDLGRSEERRMRVRDAGQPVELIRTSG